MAYNGMPIKRRMQDDFSTRETGLFHSWKLVPKHPGIRRGSISSRLETRLRGERKKYPDRSAGSDERRLPAEAVLDVAGQAGQASGDGEVGGIDR